MPMRSDLPDFIPGVAPERVADTADPGAIDVPAPSLLEAEESFLQTWRGPAGADGSSPQRTGLALSGGGVRSAAFALGVLQVLAGRRLLERFDYLSSVSGGGFVAGALIWALSSTAASRFGTGPDDFPFRAELPPDEPSAGDAAGGGSSPTKVDTAARRASEPELGSGSALASVSIGAAPSGDAVIDVGREDKDKDKDGDGDKSKEKDERVVLLNFLRQHGAYLTPGHGITLASTVAVLLRGILLNLTVWLPILIAAMLLLFAASEPFDGDLGIGDGAPFSFDILLWIAVGFGVFFLCGSLVYSFSTHPRWNIRRRRYLLHRRYETRMPWLLGPLLAAGTLSSLPWAADASLGVLGQFGGAAFVGIGLGIGFWSFLRPGNSWGVSFVRKRALPLGALLSLYGVLLFAYQSALWLHDEAGLVARALAALFLVVAVLSGWFVNLNYISMQRFYRDRLMEVFTPDIDRALARKGGPAADADGQSLSNCLDPERRGGPFPLFNAHLPLASATSRRRRLRGGDSFVLSPLYCGSAATGWCRTDRFMDDEMTLPTAMAISGSVNHQQSGLGGVGIALNPLVSSLKVLLNLRMGYWIPNPGADDQSRRPNHFVPGLAEALAAGQHERASFQLLEDGGYFDNLGLYELVRRRLRLILVCDAGADADSRLSDLHRVLQRVEVDFGARVTFEEQGGYLAVIPREPAPYPDGGKLAERGYLLGRIDYADGTNGTLVYLKSTLVPDLDFLDLGFGSRRAGFPQETTVDQFFDEEQFDAHRRLGRELARRLVEETELARRLRAPDPRD